MTPSLRSESVYPPGGEGEVNTVRDGGGGGERLELLPSSARVRAASAVARCVFSSAASSFDEESCVVGVSCCIWWWSLLARTTNRFADLANLAAALVRSSLSKPCSSCWWGSLTLWFNLVTLLWTVFKPVRTSARSWAVEVRDAAWRMRVGWCECTSCLSWWDKSWMA